MNDTPWSRRLAELSKDGWELDSGEAQYDQYGDKFRIPSRAQRASLQPGQTVGLLFRIETTKEDATTELNVEHMWAIVVGRVGNLYLGILDNQPVTIEPGYLDRGTEFVFKPEHVVGISDLLPST
jgi:hypothetical protein